MSPSRFPITSEFPVLSSTFYVLRSTFYVRPSSHAATSFRYVSEMAAAAAPVLILPVKKAAEGSQNTERPIAKPDAVALAAHAANQRSMVDRSAALPRMICRQAGLAAMAASIVPAPSDAPVPSIFQNSGARP